MIFVMRHGQTDWNAARRLQGQTDIPLNENGRRMAIDAAAKYSDLEFDICYCSPLCRARETAQLFLKGRDIPIIEDQRLMELGFGPYEGVERSTDHPEHPVNILFSEPEKYKCPEGGESLQQLSARTAEFMEQVAEPIDAEGKSILIVAHGGTNCSIIGRMKNTPTEKYWDNLTGNCQIVRVK